MREALHLARQRYIEKMESTQNLFLSFHLDQQALFPPLSVISVLRMETSFKKNVAPIRF